MYLLEEENIRLMCWDDLDLEKVYGQFQKEKNENECRFCLSITKTSYKINQRNWTLHKT